MKHIISKIQSVSMIWHVLFLVLAIINLTIPLFFNSFSKQITFAESVNDGLMAIETPLLWMNTTLTADAETITINEDFSLSILGGQPDSTNYLYFKENDLSFSVNESEYSIPYDEEVIHQDALLKTITETVQSVLLLQGIANFMIGMLFNTVVFLVLLIVARYLTKEKHLYLMKITTVPFVLVSFPVSLLSLVLQDYYLILYGMSVFIIGYGLMYLLKNIIDDNNTNYYFGNEEIFNELR